MTQRKIRNVEFTTASGQTSNWFVLDYRFEDGFERTVFGTLSNGDEIEMEVGTDQKTPPTNTQVLKTFTSANFSDVILGPIPMVRFVKTGTNGVARVTFVG